MLIILSPEAFGDV